VLFADSFTANASHTWCMASRHIWACVGLLSAAVAWAVALFIEAAPWTEIGGAVVGAGLVVVTAVAVTAVMVESSLFGYWLGVAGAGLMLVIAGMREIDTAWIVAVSLTAIAGVLMADKRLGGWIRTDGSVAPIPSKAVALGLTLLAAPILTALLLVDAAGDAILWLGLAAWGILIAFVRRLPGAVALVRMGSPLLIAGGALLELPGSALWGLLMALASALAWSKEVRLAIRPLIERGSRVSIPPELLSDEVKRAAGIDRDR
jgi:hypothetical protein